MDALFKKQGGLANVCIANFARISPPLSVSYEGFKNLKLLLRNVHSVLIFLLGRLAQENRCTPTFHSVAK